MILISFPWNFVLLLFFLQTVILTLFYMSADAAIQMVNIMSLKAFFPSVCMVEGNTSWSKIE